MTGCKVCAYFHAPKSESVLMKQPSMLYCTISCLYTLSPVWHGVNSIFSPADHTRRCSQLVLRLPYNFCIRWFVHLLSHAPYIMSCTLLPCNYTLLGLTAALSAGVATKSSLAQLCVRDAKKRQHRCDDARLTKSRNGKSKHLLVIPTESLTYSENSFQESSLVDQNVQRPGCFRYEYQNCYFFAGE